MRMRCVEIEEPAPETGPPVPPGEVDPFDPRAPRDESEPSPEFTRIVHTAHTWCGYAKGKYWHGDRGHLFSYLPYANRVAAWAASGGRLSLEWVQAEPKCPHCEREEWSARQTARKAWFARAETERQAAARVRRTWEAKQRRREEVQRMMEDGSFFARKRNLDVTP